MDNTTYPIDAGIIRCICGFDDDDGFTIQCEKCNAWQHGQCVDIYREEEVPDTYYCNRCSKRQVNVEVAIQRQLKRRENDAKGGGSGRRRSNKSVKFRTTVENPNNGTASNGTTTPKTPSTPRIEATPVEDSIEQPKPVGNRTKKRRLTVQTSQSAPSREGSDSDTDVELSASSASNKPYNASSGGLGASAISKNENGKGRSTDQILREAYKVHFVSITQSICVGVGAEQELKKIPGMDLSCDLCSFFSAAEFGRTQPVSLLVKPTNNSTTSSGNKFKFGGFSRFGVFTLADSSTVARGRYVCGLNGQLMLQQEYKANRLNQYRFLGCPKPGVVFVPGTFIAIDGRRLGSEGMFLRPNCRKPNVRISTIVVANKDIVFAAFSSEPVKPGEELTIPWEWDASHPIQKLLKADDGDGSYNLTTAEKACIATTYDSISQRGIDCACDAPSKCILQALKVIRDREEKQKSGASSHAPTSPTAESGFSAREQRKLQGTLSLIDRLAASESAKKRRRDSTSPPRYKLRTEVHSGDNEDEEMENAESEKESISYPLSFKQSLLKKYAEARAEYVANPPPPPPEDDLGIDLSPIISRSISPVVSPSLAIAPQMVLVPASIPAPSTSIVSNSSASSEITPSTSSKEPEPVANIMANTNSAPAISSSAPKLVKKLSFADYMKSKKK